MKLENLPQLLRLMADPTTTHTSRELWCRIDAIGWERCVPVLKQELESGEADVKRLVTGIVAEDFSQLGEIDRIQTFVPIIVRLLDDQDRLVRMAAVHAVRDLQLHEAAALLRRIVCEDERPLAMEALTTLIELDEQTLDEMIRFVRTTT